MTELLEHVPVNLICVALLGALGLRRLVRMERYHWLRVAVLTGLLWVPVIYIFFSILTYLFSPYYCCTPICEESNVYTITEM